jgi:hypothetical protein
MRECIKRPESQHISGLAADHRGDSNRSWGRRVRYCAALALVLLGATATAPAVATAATGSATLTELSGDEMKLSASVTENCTECIWFGEATVYSASMECPATWQSTGRGWVQKEQAREGPGTVSETEPVHRSGLEGPLVVCIYVHTEAGEELVGRSGPFDPKPPQPPPSSSTGTGNATLTEISGDELQLSVSVTENCTECVWLGYASVYSASAQCPPTWQGAGRNWVQKEKARRGPGTVSETQVVHRLGLGGPLVVCIYVEPKSNTNELVGRSGPFDPKPVPPPLVAPSSAPPPSPPLTRAQKLAKALKACKKKPRKRRGACQRRARKLYGPKNKKHRHH